MDGKDELAAKYAELTKPKLKPSLDVKSESLTALSVGWQIVFWGYILPIAILISIPLIFIGLWWVPVALIATLAARWLYVFAIFAFALRKQ